MTAQQTSVTTQDAAIVGTLADFAPSYVRSYQNEEDTDEMPIGVVVAHGTDPDAQVLLLTGSSDPIAGITVHSHGYAKPTELGDTGLKEFVTVGVLRQGVIRVYCSEAIVVGTSAVRIRIDDDAGDGALLGPGTFCKTSSGGHTVLVTAGMKWVKGCGAGGVAELDVNLAALAITAD